MVEIAEGWVDEELRFHGIAKRDEGGHVDVVDRLWSCEEDIRGG